MRNSSWGLVAGIVYGALGWYSLGGSCMFDGSWMGWNTAHALPTMGPAFGTDVPTSVQGTSSPYDLSLASDGENLFVTFDAGGGNIRGMLVDADGKPLLAEMPFYADAPEGGGNYYPSVAYGGNHYLLTWNAPSGIQGLLVGRDGKAIGTAFPVSANGFSPSLALAGDHFVIAWLELGDTTRDIAVATIGLDGNVGEPQLITNDGIAGDPELAVDDAGNVLVTWTTNVDGTNLTAEAAILDASGEVVVAPFVVQDGDFPNAPQVTSDGDSFLVAWTQYVGVRGVMVSASGAVSSPLLIADSDSASDASVSVNSQGFVVLWRDYDPSGYAVDSIRHVSGAGTLGTTLSLPEYSAEGIAEPTLLRRGDGFWLAYTSSGAWAAKTDNSLQPQGDVSPLSLVQNSQSTAELLWDGTHYVELWTDEIGDWEFTGRVMRINAAGERVESESMRLDTDENGGSWYAAASTGNGSSLIGWMATDSHDLFARVLDASGSLSPVVPLGTAGASGGISLAASSDGYLAVYTGALDGQFWARHFDAAGAVVGEATLLAVPPETYEVRVLARDEGYLLQVSDNGSTSLASLDLEGNIGGLVPLGSGIFPVDVAVGGGKTVVVWSTSTGARQARFWSGDGFAGEAFALASDGPWGDTTWDGKRFAAVWQDQYYYSHFTTFDVEGNVAPAEDLFEDEECNGPLLASNGAEQLVLSCIRYNRDYSRRVVNYLLGTPLGVPGGNTDVPPVATADDGETSAPVTMSGEDSDAPPAPDGDSTDSAATAGSNTTATSGEVTASNAEASADAAGAGGGANPGVNPIDPAEDSGCHVSRRGGGSRGVGMGAALLLGLAALTERRRRGASRAPTVRVC